eukprot:gb/GECG01006039.1/.p1 GENE.gb/GECG01006039.1/~~gb/GECG01006039.1/.p1  ORF type:complete len:2244 (+),score=294.27 gb/GECG01006039.1/:1-6732(+)
MASGGAGSASAAASGASMLARGNGSAGLATERWTTGKPNAATFSFYSDREIQALSVKQIDSPVAFDSMGHAVPGGLYDPALGPVDYGVSCTTCGLSYHNCPGHVGHISLPVPVYNPVLFEKLFKLVKLKCFACHRFRLSATRVKTFYVKLLLADCGEINKALSLETELMGVAPTSVGAAKKESSDSKQDTMKQQREILEEYEMDCIRKLRAYAHKLYKAQNINTRGLSKDCVEREGSALKSPFNYFPLPKARSPHVRAVRSQIMKEFLSSMPTKHCENCGAPVVTLRKDGSTKIFMKPLSKKAKQTLSSKHMDIQSALDLLDRRNKSTTEEDDEDSAEGEGENNAEKSSLLSNNVQYLPPTEVEAQLKLLWEKENEICSIVWAQNISPHILRAPEGPSIFFIRTLPVAPSRFRPPTKLGEMQFEHPQNYYLGQVLNLGLQLKALGGSSKSGQKNEEFQQAMNAWLKVQESVNGLIDNTKSGDRNAANGVRQILEKKEGLFRQNMMGKRVNYAARSVISPDPLIRPDQIGVPLFFATALTYPTPVTPWNVESLRRAVINGPKVHPGANFVEDEAGRLIDLSRRSKDQREALARTLLTPSADAGVPRASLGLYGKLGGDMFGNDQSFTPAKSGKVQSDGESSGSQSGTPRAETDAEWNNKSQKKSGDNEREKDNAEDSSMRYDPSFGGFGIGSEMFGTLNGGIPKRVWRHLQDGDAVLMNRQPTLHKPSIMAHCARVLRSSSQQTLRLHYANCKAYNADFDGDEMNMHFPQDELARAEAYTLATTKNQFIVPTDGQPLRGLIQDHLSLGVRFTMMDHMLTKEEYQQFVYSAVEGIPELSVSDVTGSDLRKRTGGSDLGSEGHTANMKLGIDPDGTGEASNGRSRRIRLLPPAILKPYPRWTGKQVISTILHTLTDDIPAPGNAITFHGKAKLSSSVWSERTPHLEQNMPPSSHSNSNNSEVPWKMLNEVGDHQVVVRGNELCTGVLDKASLGASAYGLPHAVYELYGSSKASALLSAFGRLLTMFLQQSSITCSMDDLSMTPSAELERRLLIKQAYANGVTSAAEWCFGEEKAIVSTDEDKNVSGSLREEVSKNKTERYGPSSVFTQGGSDGRASGGSGLPESLFELPRECKPFNTAEIRDAVKRRVRGVEAQATAVSSGKDFKQAIEEQISSWDEAIKGSLSGIQSSMINACLPKGLYKPFPENNFSLMVQTGAKGSKVNHAMIVCGLGQQELEGRRVPLMSSGKSLPCFPSYDPNPRAGGYIADRFLSGLRPQEYFFHCMSGREGLVDTAVKTANSGYLQRCMVKHLEDLRVGYDHTVRDGEGSIMQFLYGEDGIDVCSGAYLPPQGDKKELRFLADNHAALKHTYGLDQLNSKGSNVLDLEKAPALHSETQAKRRVRALAEAGTPPSEDPTGLSVYEYSIGEKIEVRMLNQHFGNYQDAGSSRSIAIATNSQGLIPPAHKFIGDEWVDAVVVSVHRDEAPSSEHKKSKKRKHKHKRKEGAEKEYVVLSYDVEYYVADFNSSETRNRKITDVVPFICCGAVGWVMRPKCPSPVTSELPLGGTTNTQRNSANSSSDFLGVVSENLRDKLDAFGREYGALMKEQSKRRKQIRKQLGIEKEDKQLSPAAFSVLLSLKALRARMHPGEPVGVTAAQSVGEPSTQMTLNTFHLAGHGGVNVTLGIPRLREIVMTASRAISTPTMTLSLHPTYRLKQVSGYSHILQTTEDKDIPGRFAEHLSRKLARLSLGDLIDFTKCPPDPPHSRQSKSRQIRARGGISVHECLKSESSIGSSANGGGWVRLYDITLRMVDNEDMQNAFGLDFAQVASIVAGKWPLLLLSQIAKEAKRVSSVAHTAKSAEEGGEAGTAQEGEQTENVTTDDARETDGTLEGNITRDEGKDYDEEEGEESEQSEDEEAEKGEEDVESSAEDGQAENTAASDDVKRQVEYNALQLKDLQEGKPVRLSAPQSVEENSRFHSMEVCLNDSRKGDGCWLRLSLVFPASHRKVLMLSAVETTVLNCLLSSTKNINRAIPTQARLPLYEATRHRRLRELRDHKMKNVMAEGDLDENERQQKAFEAMSSIDDSEAGTEGDEKQQVVVQTEGVNIPAMWEWSHIVDPHRLYTNDIWAIRESYGVEAARASIIREIRSVFEVYGIGVDPRHLSLIADYMTYEGGFKGMNRIGMENAGSSFTQMSFETTTKFLTKAATHGATQGGYEQLESPSSRLVMGQSISYGTGSSQMRQPLVGL